jgi:hypothetical protein
VCLCVYVLYDGNLKGGTEMLVCVRQNLGALQLEAVCLLNHFSLQVSLAVILLQYPPRQYHESEGKH